MACAIEIYDDRLRAIVPPETSLQKLANGGTRRVGAKAQRNKEIQILACGLNT
ncbi:hypothetical protein H6G04_31980 [Calothrix membranacea FACHB-236]|nr:hypothetical protein [Calothrix membranacea FACHB-236]